MATTQVHIKTITEVSKSTGAFSIHSFSDKNSDGSTAPSIFKSQVLTEVKIIDNVEGKEGELMISSDSEHVGKLENGELILDVSNDDTQRYSRGGEDNAYLIYTE